MEAKSRKRKQKKGKSLPVTFDPHAKKPKPTSTASREVISKFHTLVKKLETASEHEKKEIQKEIDQMGGLKFYQDASIQGHEMRAQGHTTAKWVTSMIKQHNPNASSEHKLTLLDVGALTNHYLDYTSWLQITPIDLEPRHPSVQRCDFFDFPTKHAQFDVIVLSLVMNFVGQHARRGEMLWRCRNMLRDGGFLFLILPLACTRNSRFTTHESLVALMDSLSLELVEHKESPKLTYFMCKLREGTDRMASPPVIKRKIINDAPGRNNFSVTLQPSSDAPSTATDDNDQDNEQVVGVESDADA